MKKIQLALLFITVFAFSSCQSKIYLKTDEHLTEVFTDREIAEIQKMISYVDDRVVELTNNRDINEGYHYLFDKVNIVMRDSSKSLIPFDEEEKYEFLESLDSTVFDEFWTIGRVKNAIYKDSIYQDLDNYKILDIKSRGRYIDYLGIIGENDAYYKSVKQSLDASGSFTPGIVASFLKIQNELDFTIPKNRLWAAVFILRIEEPHDKKMERYLNQKKGTKDFLL